MSLGKKLNKINIHESLFTISSSNMYNRQLLFILISVLIKYRSFSAFLFYLSKMLLAALIILELQDWIVEMSSYVKSIDKNHLLTVGLEGFYGPNSPKKSTVNPGEYFSLLGSDFIRNSEIATIDFASAHIYPDHW